MANKIILTLKTPAKSKKIHVTISGVKEKDLSLIKAQLFNLTDQESDGENDPETDQELSLIQKGKSFRGVTYLTKQKLTEFTKSLDENNILFEIR